MNKQTKKLTLNKETLRDLTTQNAGAVKGGDKGGKYWTVTCTCNSCGKVFTCIFTHLKGCNGPTYNNKCGY